MTYDLRPMTYDLHDDLRPMTCYRLLLLLPPARPFLRAVTLACTLRNMRARRARRVHDAMPSRYTMQCPHTQYATTALTQYVGTGSGLGGRGGCTRRIQSLFSLTQFASLGNFILN